MKILHTSDWHLGRTLHGHLLFDAQEAAVNHIVDEAIRLGVDAVIVAGDVYDRPSPPPESIRLFNSAIVRLDQAGISILVTAGNHDSADRLATYSSVLKSNIRIAGSVSDLSAPLELTDDHGSVLIYPVTFLHPDVACLELADDPASPLDRQHEVVMAAAVERIRQDLEVRIAGAKKPVRTIAVAHAFVGSSSGTKSVRQETADGIQDAGLEVSTSERDLSIGGIQIVPSSVFEGFDYVALGHLHGQQSVPKAKGSKTIARYSGSLLRYSMSERNHNKSFTLVHLGEPGTEPVVELHEIPQPRGMARLQGTMDELLSSKNEKHRDDFVEVTVTDSKYPDGMYARIKEVFPFLLNLIYNPEGKALGGGAAGVRMDARKLSPMEAMAIFFEQASGAVLEDEALSALQKAYDAANKQLGVK